MLNVQYHISATGTQRLATYFCALATLSTTCTIMLTYFHSHPIFTDYSHLLTLNTSSSVSLLFNIGIDDHRQSNDNLKFSNPLIIQQSPTPQTRYTSTAVNTTNQPRPTLSHDTTEIYIKDIEANVSQAPPTVHLSHILKTHATENSRVCAEDNCLEYLSSSEKSIVKKCERKTMKPIDARIIKGSCNFLSHKSRRAVALASPEGSGNTWLRGLLEKATGVCTGFCCCDTETRARGFVGEGIMSGKVLVVKTHIDFPQWIGQVKKLKWEGSYGSAILLIRNPAKAMIAEWNRKRTISLKGPSNNSHVNVISKAVFMNEKWKGFCKHYLEQWIKRLNNWVFNNHHHPVHVVSYEDLKRDTVGEVEKILDFLKFPYSHNELAERLRQNYTDFQRPHTNDHFQHFSPEQKENLRTTLLTVMATAKASGKSPLFHFDEYLDSLPNIL